MHTNQRIVLIRDHSVSMSGLRTSAMNDYNSLLNDIKLSAGASRINTKLTVVNCGKGTRESLYSPFRNNMTIANTRGQLISVDFVDVDINIVASMTFYDASGSNTPLLDSIGKAIELMAERYSSDTPILVMGITDGQENASRTYNSFSIANLINSKQKTGMWTFAFRCPRNYAKFLVNIGIPRENILEWDQTTKGMEESTDVATTSMREYYSVRASGETSSTRFFVDPKNLRVKDIKDAHMNDVTNDVMFLTNGPTVQEIRPFVVASGYNYIPGHWYYELTKTETLQANKRIIIRNKNTRKVYAGNEARDLLGLPYGDNVKIVPSGINSTNYQIFVQSLSVNRKLMPNTMVCNYTK